MCKVLRPFSSSTFFNFFCALCFASSSVCSLPDIAQWAETHCNVTHLFSVRSCSCCWSSVSFNVNISHSGEQLQTQRNYLPSLAIFGSAENSSLHHSLRASHNLNCMSKSERGDNFLSLKLQVYFASVLIVVWKLC